MRSIKTITRQGLSLLIIILSFSGILNAQVVIKERVIIGSGGVVPPNSGMIKGNVKTMFTSNGVISGFVMQKTGQLQVYYAFCDRLDYELPANAALVVHFLKGDSSRIDSIIPRFSNMIPWTRYIYNGCLGEYQYRNAYNYNITGSPENVYLYNVGRVSQGDTIQFFYSSNSIVTGDSVLYAIYGADSLAPGSWNVIFGDYDWCITDFNDQLNIYVGVEANEILLGETKYYFVRDNSGNAYIDTTTNPNVNPGVQDNSVWSNNPVITLTDADSSGKRLGVYWEKKRPDGTDLPAGMIRLIGRYWYADSIYQVKLNAVYDGDSLSKTIEVKKPDKLGDENGYAKNVFDSTYNIDSVIIKHAGKYGIPPQFIKSQIEKESNFHPSYLYEPFLDLKFQTKRDDSIQIYSNQYRIKSNTDIGNPGLPTNRTNVWNVLGKTSYPGYGGTIWAYYDLYKNSLYRRINSKGVVVYQTLNDIWKDSLVNPIKKDLIKQGVSKNDANNQAEQLANDSLPKYLRYEYMNGVMDALPAQTRIVSSYGLMQMIYYYAKAECGYSVDDAHLPETINVTDTSLTYGLKHLQAKFKFKKKGQVLNENFEASTGWQYGFEGTFRRAMNFYSNRSDYGAAVITNAKKYLPKLK
jgi:hypothetical protein